MIELTLREHGTHNIGMGIDITFDLNQYESSTEILEELFEQTKEYLENEKIKYKDIDHLEEWIITDIEIDSEYLKYDNFFDKYMSLDLLIELNTFLEKDIQYHISLAMFLEDGNDLKYSIENIESENIIPYMIGDKEYKSEEKLLGEWLVYESDFFGDLPNQYKSYINFEYFSKEFGQDMITHTFKNGEVYTLTHPY